MTSDGWGVPMARGHSPLASTSATGAPRRYGGVSVDYWRSLRPLGAAGATIVVNTAFTSGQHGGHPDPKKTAALASDLSAAGWKAVQRHAVPPYMDGTHCFNTILTGRDPSERRSVSSTVFFANTPFAGAGDSFAVLAAAAILGALLPLAGFLWRRRGRRDAGRHASAKPRRAGGRHRRG